MSEPLRFHFDVDGSNFTSAGEASIQIKQKLRQLGFAPDIIKRVAISMYEGEINMVIHAGGGTADVYVLPETIKIVLEDHGPGIADVELAMQEAFQLRRIPFARSVLAPAWGCRT